jgi:hypothetical protein
MNEVVSNPGLEHRQHLWAHPRPQPMRPERSGRNAERREDCTDGEENAIHSSGAHERCGALISRGSFYSSCSFDNMMDCMAVARAITGFETDLPWR